MTSDHADLTVAIRELTEAIRGKGAPQGGRDAERRGDPWVDEVAGCLALSRRCRKPFEGFDSVMVRMFSERERYYKDYALAMLQGMLLNMVEDIEQWAQWRKAQLAGQPVTVPPGAPTV